MGNCRSQPTAAAEAASPTATPTATTTKDRPPLPSKNEHGNASAIFQPVLSKEDADSCSSTATLIRAIIPLVMPIIRKAVSQQLIKDDMVLHKEVKIKDITELHEFPIGPLRIQLDTIEILDYARVQSDVEAMPEFDWPEKERMQTLIETALHPPHNNSSPSSGVHNVQEDPPSMLVFDITGVSIKASLGPDMELEVPAVESGAMVNAFGKVKLEIGTGGSIEEAWVKIMIPRFRIWYVSDTKKVYVAFMGRPQVLPHLHVNADRGKGDFWHVELTPKTSALDDIVESVLCGFGPSSLMKHANDNAIQNGASSSPSSKPKAERSWVGNALGRTVSQAIGKFAGVGNNRPLEIDLKETIDQTIETALGKPRPVDAIQADIERLQKELVVAKEYEQLGKNVKNQAEKGQVQEEKKEEFDNPTPIDLTIVPPEQAFANPLLCCGIGSI